MQGRPVYIKKISELLGAKKPNIFDEHSRRDQVGFTTVFGLASLI